MWVGTKRSLFITLIIYPNKLTVVCCRWGFGLRRSRWIIIIIIIIFQIKRRKFIKKIFISISMKKKCKFYFNRITILLIFDINIIRDSLQVFSSSHPFLFYQFISFHFEFKWHIIRFRLINLLLDTRIIKSLIRSRRIQ